MPARLHLRSGAGRTDGLPAGVSRFLRGGLRLWGSLWGIGVVAWAGCGPAPPQATVEPTPAWVHAPAAPIASAEAPSAPGPLSDVALPAIAWLHDDYEGALAQARDQKKLLLVDVWAPWCHTCLAMKDGVLQDPALRPFADRVVFLALDSDRPESASFLADNDVRAWPSFFVIQPTGEPGAAAAEQGRVLGLIAGAASVAEMVGLLDESIVLSTRPGESLLAVASAATASRNHAGAAEAYQRYVQSGATSRRSDALLGWIRALSLSGQFRACVALGIERAEEITGAAAPADFTYTLRGCAKQLKDAPEARRAQRIAVDRLRTLTEAPPEGASLDDRADALSQLADALREIQEPVAARRADEARLSLMNEAAAAATSPAARAIYDYQRAGAYLALGRGEEAAAMLKQREAEMPEAYEPPARLAWVLTVLGRHGEARRAIDRALLRSYGPRRLRYLSMKADILEKLGDAPARLEALRAIVSGEEALPEGQRSERNLEQARARLEAAERAGR